MLSTHNHSKILTMKAAVRERYEKEVSVDDVVAEANEIWALFKKNFPRTEEHAKVELSDFYKEMQTEHPQFGSTYPIVLRYMCEIGQYHAEALRKWLRYITHHPWKSVESYLESQAKYALILYKQLNRHYKPTDAARYYDNVLKMLKSERKAFEAEAEAAKTEVDKNHERMKLRNAIELREFYAMYGKEAVDVPIKVVAADAATMTPEEIAALPHVTTGELILTPIEADADIDAGGF